MFSCFRVGVTVELARTTIASQMVDITIAGDRAIFRVEGMHKLWAFRSELEIPLAHIRGVDVTNYDFGCDR